MLLAVIWTLVFTIAFGFSFINARGAYRERDIARRFTGLDPVYLITANAIYASEVVRCGAFFGYMVLGLFAIIDSKGAFVLLLGGPLLLTGGAALMTNTILSFRTRRRVSSVRKMKGK